MNEYKGYLLKINGKVFPNRYILMDSYLPKPHQLTDLDSFVDADGYLNRNVMPHARSRIVFNTANKLTLDEKIEIQKILPTSKTGRIKLMLEYWSDDTNTYHTGDFYIPDIEYPMHDANSETIIYNSISIELIEY